MTQGNNSGGSAFGLGGIPGVQSVSSRFQPYLLEPGSPNAYTCFGSWESGARSCMPIDAVDDPLDGCSQAGECQRFTLDQNPPTTRFGISPRRDGRFEIQQFRDFIRDQDSYNMVVESGRIIVTYPGNRAVPKAKRFFLNVRNLEEADLDVNLEFELLVTAERMILRQAGAVPVGGGARAWRQAEEDPALRRQRIAERLRQKAGAAARGPELSGDELELELDLDFDDVEIDDDVDDEEDIEIDLGEDDAEESGDEEAIADPDLGVSDIEDLDDFDAGDLDGLDGLDGDDEEGGDDEEAAPAAPAEEDGAAASPKKGKKASGKKDGAKKDAGKKDGGKKDPDAAKKSKKAGPEVEEPAPAKASAAKKGKKVEPDEDEAPAAKSAAPKKGKKAEPEVEVPVKPSAKAKKAEAPPPVKAAPAKKGKVAEPEPAPPSKASGGKKAKAAEPEPPKKKR